MNIREKIPAPQSVNIEKVLERIKNDSTVVPQAVKKVEIDYSKQLITLKAKMELQKMKPINEMMFGDYIWNKEVTLIGAATNIGKSLFSYDFAISIATNVNLMNEKNEMPADCIGLYFDYENKDHQLLRWFRNRNIPDNLITVDECEFWQAMESSTNVIDRIKELVEFRKPQFIVIDNIGILNDRSTSEQNVALGIMKQLKRMCTTYGIAIIVITHFTKQPDKSIPLNLYMLEGSAKITNYADSVLLIGRSRENNNYRYIKQLKGRNGATDITVKLVEIVENPYLHFEFVKDDDEANHLEKAGTKENKKLDNLKELAEKYFSTIGIRNADFLKSFIDGERKSVQRAKQVWHELKVNNLILEFDKGKWILNGNEISADNSVEEDIEEDTF